VLKIEGHTDNVGNRYRNLLLSEERTLSVEEWLIKKGITTERIDIIGYGPDQPIESNETKAGRAQNRRVEMSYSLLSPLTSSSEASE
jgi:OmpA-OmpF porin, OOP family